MPKYCLKLTSNVTKVNLPRPLEHYKNIKFNMISYVTGSANNRLMRVDVTGFNENIYFDGVNVVKYAKIYSLPNSISTLMVDVSETDKNDVEVQARDINTGITSLVVEITIDDLFQDITPSNVLYLEFTIS